MASISEPPAAFCVKPKMQVRCGSTHPHCGRLRRIIRSPLHRGGDAPGYFGVGTGERVLCEVGVSSRCGGLRMAEERADHGKREALRGRNRCKAVAEVVDAHIVEPGQPSYPTPGLLQVHKMRPWSLAADDIGVVRQARDTRQNLERRIAKMDRLLAGLAVPKAEHPPPDIDLGPAQRADFAEASAGEDEQPDGCDDPWGGQHFTFGGGESTAQPLELLLRQEPLTFALAELLDVTTGLALSARNPCCSAQLKNFDSIAMSLLA